MIIEGLGVPGVGKSTAMGLLVERILPPGAMDKRALITAYRHHLAPFPLPQRPVIRTLLGIPHALILEGQWWTTRVHFTHLRKLLTSGASHIGRRCVLDKQLAQFYFDHFTAPASPPYVLSEGLLQACAAMRVWAGADGEQYATAMQDWFLRMQKTHPWKIMHFSADERTLWKRLQQRGIPPSWPTWAQNPAGAKEALSRFRVETESLSRWAQQHGCTISRISLDGTMAETERTLRRWARQKRTAQSRN